jgi:hypothetical protein
MNEARAAPGVLTFTIPLTTLGEVSDLLREPQARVLLAAARRYPDAPIHVRAYVTVADTRVHHADAAHLSDEMVLQTASYLAEQGIDPNRISGKGMGIDENIGRALVVSMDLGEAPRERLDRDSEVA